MPFYSVPMTVLATVNVFAESPVLARMEARRYVEGLKTGDFYKDGWNDIQRQNGAAIIDQVDGWAVENIELAEIEELPARWTVVPQRDWHADATTATGEPLGTRFEACEDASATAWAVFETRDDASELVEDYPTREQAEAAVKALEGNHPLPDPIWPEDALPEVPAEPCALIADAMVLLDAVNDAESDNQGRCFVYLADGRVLRVSVEVVGGAK